VADLAELLSLVGAKGLDPGLLRVGTPQTSHVPPAVAGVYALVDGVDAAEWARRFGGTRPYLVPSLELQSADEALGLRTELREVAQETGARWESSWWPLLVAHPGHVVAVDELNGSVWNVFWEATVVEPIASSLAEYWTQCIDFLEGFRFDAEHGLWQPPPGWEGPDGPWGEADPALEESAGVDVSDWRRHSVADAFEALLQVHREADSGVVAQLRPPASESNLDRAEAALGFALHPQVRALYRIADGLEDNAGSGFDGLRLLPSLRFQPLEAVVAVEHANRIARTAALGDGSWRLGWLPVFTESSVGRGVHVDCSTPEAVTWRVEWNPSVADLPGSDVGTAPIAPSLAAFLLWCGRAMARMDLVKDATEHGRIRDRHYYDDLWVNVIPPFGPRSTW
jgi:cell wall assembly regulator SMI1